MVRRNASLTHSVFASLLLALGVFAVTGEIAIRNAAEGVAVALLVLSAVTRKDSPVAWRLIAAGNVAWLVGDLGGTLTPLYLVSYAFAYAGIVTLIATTQRRAARGLLALDGVLAGLTAAAILTGFVSEALTGPGVAVPMTMLGGDAMIVTTIVVAFAVNDWRPGRGWWVFALAEVVLVTTDLAVVGKDAPTLAASVGWAVGLVLTSYAPFHPAGSPAPRRGGRVATRVPVVGGAVALVLLMHAALTGGSALTIWLAGSAILVGLVRASLLIADNQKLIRMTRADATTDKLTGLPNRRALERDLGRAFATNEPHTLAFLDLDGFKEYNDAFGHAAGDALLQRLAPQLGGYRLGGDEFCVLLAGALTDESPEVQRAVDALSEHGEGFSIGASFGLVVLPREATNADDALKRADERMYARKRSRRGGPGGQTRDVLVQVLAERGRHADDVPALAADVGRRVGLSGEEIDVLVRAAELRDVGLIAVPEGAEELRRLHPVVGERILAAADSMRPVARIVRSAHERYDGSGFPDGLKREEIPLAARIIAACAGGHDPELSAAVAASRAARAPARSASFLSESGRTS